VLRHTLIPAGGKAAESALVLFVVVLPECSSWKFECEDIMLPFDVPTQAPLPWAWL
jgi:hypothetical protein